MNYEWYFVAYTATVCLSAALVPGVAARTANGKICMTAQQERRRRRAKNNRHGTEGNPRPSRKTLAAMLRGIANGLSLTYSTCVTVQRALQNQNSDEDTEIGDCLRHYVAAPLTRYVEDLRDLAQSLHPTEETP